MLASHQFIQACPVNSVTCNTCKTSSSNEWRETNRPDILYKNQTSTSMLSHVIRNVTYHCCNKMIFLEGWKYVRCIGLGRWCAELNSVSNDVISTDGTCSGAEKFSLEWVVPCDIPCHLPSMKKINFYQVRNMSGASDLVDDVQNWILHPTMWSVATGHAQGPRNSLWNQLSHVMRHVTYHCWKK